MEYFSLNNPTDVRNLTKQSIGTQNLIRYLLCKENKFTNTNELNYIIRLKNYYTQSTLTKEQLEKNKNDLLKFVRETNPRRNKNFTNTFTTFINHKLIHIQNSTYKNA